MPVSNMLMFQYAVTSKVQISGKYSEYFFYYYLLMPSSSTTKEDFLCYPDLLLVASPERQS